MCLAGEDGGALDRAAGDKQKDPGGGADKAKEAQIESPDKDKNNKGINTGSTLGFELHTKMALISSALYLMAFSF